MPNPSAHYRPLARTWPARIHPAWTVNDALRHFPATARIFNAFGIDACCGGATLLADAARDADLDPAALLDALECAACPCGGTGDCAAGADAAR